MKTSVLIPCFYAHFKHIPNLLTCYANQTLLPDEVIISLSECDKVPSALIEEVETTAWPFHLRVIKSERKIFAGGNRNIAGLHACGDLFICQDADDIPHPQRIEILKHFFENFKVDHLNHCFLFPSQGIGFQKYKIENIRSCSTREFRKMHPSRFQMANGEVALTRAVFNAMRWSDKKKSQEDLKFNRLVEKQFDHCVILFADLLFYRNELSSFNPKNHHP